MMTSRRLLLAGWAGLGLVGPGLGGSANAQSADLQEITLAVSSTSFVLGGVRIGERAGLFGRNRLAPRIIVMDSGNAAMSALLGGSVQFAVTGPPETLAARARKQDVVIVANLYAGLAGSVVLGTPVVERLGVSPTAPVKDRLRALDGLVLAVPSATSALLAPVKAAAEEAGARIRFTYMAQGAMPAALENNAIQGMIASFPFAGAPILRGTGVLWINGPSGELPAGVLPSSSSSVQTSAKYLDANRETVGRLQKTVMDIGVFIEKDPAAAQRALAAAYSQLSAQEIELAFTQQWRNWTKPFLTEADIRQELRLLKLSSKLPGLDELDPASVLVGPP